LLNLANTHCRAPPVHCRASLLLHLTRIFLLCLFMLRARGLKAFQIAGVSLRWARSGAPAVLNNLSQVTLEKVLKNDALLGTEKPVDILR
jgi:hypothetical protein